MVEIRMSLKVIAAIGAILLIVGFLLFLHSLGTGGAFFPAFLIAVGAVLLVVSIIYAVVRFLQKRALSSD
jgi:membrane protease YdiL (CAAX protease family)